MDFVPVTPGRSPWRGTVNGPSEPEGPGRKTKQQSHAWQPCSGFLTVRLKPAPADLGPGTGHRQGRTWPLDLIVP